MRKYTKIKEMTLCWDCANACTDGCSWSKSFIPVEGWDAVEMHIGRDPSYLVKECPKFVPDDKDSRLRDLDTDGCLRLAEKLMEITREDYIKGRQETVDEVERFIRSKRAARLHMISNPEHVIAMLKKARINYRKKLAQTTL